MTGGAPLPRPGDVVMCGVENTHGGGFTPCVAICTGIDPHGGVIFVAAFAPTGQLVPLPASPIAYSAEPRAGRWWPR